MVRLHMVVEGQTEEAFINTMLVEHLALYNVFADVRCVQTSRRRGRIFRGGLLDYARAKKDLELWIKEDRNPDAYFTTMFDLYALPQDFPSYDEAKKYTSAYQRVALLEQAFSRDIGSYRFVPYIQLHEFEALILVDPAKFDCEFIKHAPRRQPHRSASCKRSQSTRVGKLQPVRVLPLRSVWQEYSRSVHISVPGFSSLKRSESQ